MGGVSWESGVRGMVVACPVDGEERGRRVECELTRLVCSEQQQQVRSGCT